MASYTRSGRRPTASNASSAYFDVASLSNVERLLVAQAVHEVGASAWPHVSKLLSKHPMLSRPKSFFTAQSCHTIYNRLMKEAELDITDANNAPRDGTNLKLAQKHYQARVLELRSLIQGEEAKFKKVVAEIEEIRSGLWDAKIKAKITGVPIAERQDIVDEKSPTEPVKEDIVLQDVTRVDERFGSDLTGITDSDEAAKATKTPTENRESPLAADISEDIVEVSAEETPTPEDDEELADDTVMPADSSNDTTRPSADEATLDQDSEAMHTPADENVVDIESPEHTEGTPVEDDTDASVVDIDISGDAEGDRSPSPPAQAASRLRESKRKASDIEGSSHESQRDKKRPREESEPMDEDEQGPSSGAARRRRTEEQVANKRFQNVIGMLHSQISQHRNGNIFHNPIKDSEAPDYREIVKRPMDLKTIKARIKDGVITTSLEFQRDVFLMFTNAMMYNRPDSDIYTMAEEMMLESEGHINAFRQTEGLIGGHAVSRGSRPFLKGTTN